MILYQYAKFELAGFCHFSATQGFLKSLKKEKKEKEKEKEKEKKEKEKNQEHKENIYAG